MMGGLSEDSIKISAAVYCFTHKSVCCLITFFFLSLFLLYLSHHMGKPTICIGENKGADQLRLCFRYSDSTVPLSSSFLWLYRSVYVGPVRKPHCWFSHKAAIIFYDFIFITLPLQFLQFLYHLLSERRRDRTQLGKGRFHFLNTCIYIAHAKS